MDDLTCTGCGEYAGSPIANRIEELEAKLAKAVEALHNVVVEYNLFRKDEYERGLSPLDDEIHDARTTLAELKGETDG